MSERFHILHVEDDDLDALNVQRYLRNCDSVAGITVAHDPVEALDLLRSGRLPLRDLVILLDIRLPRMSGLEFMRELRADPALSRLPVVVLSTSDDEHDKGTAYDLHAAGYMIKPFSPDSFRRCMNAFARYWASTELL